MRRGSPAAGGVPARADALGSGAGLGQGRCVREGTGQMPGEVGEAGGSTAGDVAAGGVGVETPVPVAGADAGAAEA